MENEKINWVVCPKCKGQGTKNRRIHKKTRNNYQIALEQFEKTNKKGIAPVPPKAQPYNCLHCSGSGLIHSTTTPFINKENYPHIAIIGGGIGGIALAIACLHRGIPFTLYERDQGFDTRSQGYGLTLQQGSKAIKGLGILDLKEGIVSTKHIVHNPEGKIIGEWGMRKWTESDKKTTPKRTNIHIARQSLRLILLEQLGGHDKVQWGHQLIDFKETENKNIELSFQVDGKIKKNKANLVVGADGIRSTVRKLLIGEEINPLRYLNCMVILGICPLNAIKNTDRTLLDTATVFQTANGHERIYVMPYSSNTVMWQLSFPIAEDEAKLLNKKGAKALKEEACRRLPWHDPIPQILNATQETLISGYPVYDRAMLSSELLDKNITLIGDAAHPMSPFKGQGANQALLDALTLAREITKQCEASSLWKTHGLRKNLLTNFETEMLTRSASKVKDSATAAQLLHSKAVLKEGNAPRGRHLNEK